MQWNEHDQRAIMYSSRTTLLVVRRKVPASDIVKAFLICHVAMYVIWILVWDYVINKTTTTEKCSGENYAYVYFSELWNNPYKNVYDTTENICLSVPVGVDLCANILTHQWGVLLIVTHLLWCSVGILWFSKRRVIISFIFVVNIFLHQPFLAEFTDTPKISE